MKNQHKPKQPLTWTTAKRKVNELLPAGYNPRKMSENERRDLEDSIKEFGTVVPVVLNTGTRSNVLIGGHQRVSIYADLEIKEIAVMVPSRELDEREEKTLNLRLNKNTGSWDAELLKAFDTDLLLEAGFEPDDLNELFDDMLEVGEDGFDLDKELKNIEIPNTKPGELYQLGTHRLLCGDALKSDDIGILMGKEKAGMIYCDPPYNISLDYYKGVSTQGKYSPSEMVNDHKTTDQYREFLNASIKNALAVSNPDVHVFYWCDEKYIWLLQNLYEENGIANKRVCLWVKNNIDPTPQVAFNKVLEMCAYGTQGKPLLNKGIKNLNEILNQDINSSGIYDDLMSLVQMWLVKRDSTTDYEHPTQKPITLNEKPIKRCTAAGGIVLDLFGGSGSTLIACEQLKRRAFMMELDPVYCDVIIKRYELFTGDQAKKIN